MRFWHENKINCNGNLIKFVVCNKQARIENRRCPDIMNSVKLVSTNFYPDKNAMNNRPIHENLDTSFVNLSALLRYLRRREFVGKINVELSGYAAEIVLTGGNEIKIQEHDRIAGRIAEGEEALQRLLIRAREPGGIVNVYQTAENEKEKIEEIIEETEPIISRPAVSEIPKPKPFVSNGTSAKPQFDNIKDEIVIAKPPVKLPDFPFNLTNKVEAKARRVNLSPQHWQTLLDLTGELLGKIDETLETAKLDFKAAFDKACLEIADDYPFFADCNDFVYQNGKISMREQTAATVFVGGIFEVLRRILDKLGSFPKYRTVHQQCLKTLDELKERRKRFYDKFSITPQIERILTDS